MAMLKIYIAGLCKGSTTDSDSVCEGSNPSLAANKKACNRNGYRLLLCFRRAVFPLIFPLETGNALDVILHPSSAFCLHALGCVTVNVQCKGCCGMAQVALNGSNVISGTQRSNGVTVS